MFLNPSYRGLSELLHLWRAHHVPTSRLPHCLPAGQSFDQAPPGSAVKLQAVRGGSHGLRLKSAFWTMPIPTFGRTRWRYAKRVLSNRRSVGEKKFLWDSMEAMDIIGLVLEALAFGQVGSSRFGR